MGTMNISLPEPMKEFVEDEVSKGHYSSASEYVRFLLREEQKRRAQEKLEALLLEGLESGDPIELTNNEKAKIRDEALQRMKAKE